DTLRARAVGIFGGVTYYFCSADCKSKFKDPRQSGGAAPPMLERRRAEPAAPSVSASTEDSGAPVRYAHSRIRRITGEVGTPAERYRLTRKIGEGGRGVVYEAQHVLLARAVAVKVLRDKYLDRPEVARRLVQEARLASSIRHENIVDITDSCSTEDGRTFVV